MKKYSQRVIEDHGDHVVLDDALHSESDLLPLIEHRIAVAAEMLREQSAADPFAEQRHLDAGTVERAYWHHGYLMALRDVVEQLIGDTTP